MQFRTIRTALDHEGEVTYIRDLTPRSRGLWFCRSCNNPLRLHWTHDNGGYFEHDLEDANERRLTHCAYQIIARDKPVSFHSLFISLITQLILITGTKSD